MTESAKRRITVFLGGGAILMLLVTTALVVRNRAYVEGQFRLAISRDAETEDKSQAITELMECYPQRTVTLLAQALAQYEQELLDMERAEAKAEKYARYFVQEFDIRGSSVFHRSRFPQAHEDSIWVIMPVHGGASDFVRVLVEAGVTNRDSVFGFASELLASDDHYLSYLGRLLTVLEVSDSRVSQGSQARINELTVQRHLDFGIKKRSR